MIGNVKFYNDWANALKDKYLENIVVHPLSPEEIHTHRLQTWDLIVKINELRAYKQRIAPQHDSAAENRLFLVTRQYYLMMPRLFRVNELPAEILGNIFHYMIWSSSHSVNSRLALTSVCRLWRNIAIGDATLWNAIWFRDPPHYERSLAWLQRSGNGQLDVRIGDTDNHKITAQEMSVLFDRLEEKIGQIRIFVSVAESWEANLEVLRGFNAYGKRGLPLAMEHLELHYPGASLVHTGNDLGPQGYQPLSLFGGAVAPHLKNILLNKVPVNWEMSHLSNLRNLDLRSIPPHRFPPLSVFRGMLKSSPNLFKLYLESAGPKWERNNSEANEPISLPNMKILILSDFSLGYAMYILGQIQAPGVRDLALMNLMGEDYTPLFAFLTDKFPDLRMLTMWSVETASSRLMVKWLSSMPKLTFLKVHNLQPHFLSFFLECPNPASAKTSRALKDRVVCPELSILEVESFNPDIVLQWVVSRQGRGVPLKKLYSSPSFFERLTPEQHQTLCRLTMLYRLEEGVSVPEEDTLLED
ncbi:hypothetical protein AMATHDRAFT_146808 [Amanita thiersii Skay4041]|uniref:F-box domain-containing protein n=1 Tax=Amanita thiersii Skay4041 TaxID=703135 RepID=A0A2A9NIA6_9AGAR|nr:hypothetical protein AMATHDRAFT_146808 [Amanita thiersii Skay4041]